MSRFYDGQPVVCVWEREKWGPELFEFVPTLGQRCVVVQSRPNPVCISRIDVELRESRPRVWYDERGFEPITENQVRALEAIATDVPDNVSEKIRRELQDA